MTHRFALFAVIVAMLGLWWIAGPNTVTGQALKIGAPAPELGGGPWIGSEPLTLAALRGRVTLLEFWTYG